ncbi:MAG: transcriptional regulator [Sulfurimonas sp.]|nr:MAG: transcriptional regulator [Sulfurimonas sp.]
MNKLVRLAKLFSNINRLKIFALILRDKKVCVCEICDSLELSQPLVSRHLKFMREEEVLNCKKEKKWVVYFLNEEYRASLQFWIDETQKYTHILPELIACKK